MALKLNKTGITNGNTVQAYHVTQSIDAFTGIVAYDISLSGSFNLTGSVTNGTPDNIANNFSHAEGQANQATGYISHAEGLNNFAVSVASHAEGILTLALGSGSHAEGYATTASGNYSHAEGYQTQALGQGSFAGGVQNIANGNYAFSIGYLTYAETSAFSAGTATSASGQYSMAIGDTTKTIGLSSFAAGRGTIASGSQQFVIGEYNTQNDNTSIFVVGNGNISTRKDAFKVRMSGSIVLPTTQSAAPTWTGTNGEIVPATVGGVHRLYMWMAGAWRSSSFS